MRLDHTRLDGEEIELIIAGRGPPVIDVVWKTGTLVLRLARLRLFVRERFFRPFFFFYEDANSMS